MVKDQKLMNKGRMTGGMKGTLEKQNLTLCLFLSSCVMCLIAIFK